MISYTYVVVRTDIPVAQQIVQACHAAQEAAWAFERPQDEVYLCLQAVPDLQGLIHAFERASARGVRASMFYEPDNDMGYSAFATEPVPQDFEGRRAIFKNNLWEEPNALKQSRLSDVMINPSIITSKGETQMEPRKQRTLTPEQRKAVRKTWDTYIRMKVTDKPHHHLLYLLIMDKNPLIAFAPVKNEKKIANLAQHYRGPHYKLVEALKKLEDELTRPWHANAGSDKIRLRATWYSDENAGRTGETIRRFHHLPENNENALTFPNSEEITAALIEKVHALQKALA